MLDRGAQRKKQVAGVGGVGEGEAEFAGIRVANEEGHMSYLNTWKGRDHSQNVCVFWEEGWHKICRLYLVNQISISSFER